MKVVRFHCTHQEIVRLVDLGNMIAFATAPIANGVCVCPRTTFTRARPCCPQIIKRPASARRCVPVCIGAARSPAKSPPQPTPFDPKNSALLEGIRAVAVGKNGARPVPIDLLPSIRDELDLAKRTPLITPYLDLHLLRASFLGSLFVKAKHSSDERKLLSYATRGQNDEGDVSPAEVLGAIGARQGHELISFALRVMNGERLSTEDAAALGDLLFDRHLTDEVDVWVVKALIAHVMRVRHESSEELCGLAKAARRTISHAFRVSTEGVENERPYVHVAEPFDGTITNDMLTPLLCERLRDVYGLRTVMSVGVSSGPKYGPNLRDVALELGLPFCRNADQVAERSAEKYGAVVDQMDCSPDLDSWVHMRRVILKRPGIATVEKYVDACPGGAAMFIGSAFHEGYIEKMADVAEGLVYEAYIIVGKGMEGTTGLGAGLKRTATVLTGWRTVDGSFRRERVDFQIASDGDGIETETFIRPVKGSADCKVSAERIRLFSENGTSGDPYFDIRARATLGAFDKTLSVLRDGGVSFLQGIDI